MARQWTDNRENNVKKSTGNEISEVLKIRHFVMNIIYRNGGKSVMIPSSRALAARFGIARSTVQLSLEKMSAQGFLIGKPGIGTFTNPRKSFILQLGEPAPLTGIKVAGGDDFYYICTTWRMFSETGNALVNSGCSIHLLQDATSTPETIQQEIRNAFLDGVLFLGSPEPVIRKAAEIVPAVSIGHTPVPDVCSVFFSINDAVRELVRTLRRDGRTRILLTHDGETSIPAVSATRKALEEDGFELIPLDVKSVDFVSEFHHLTAEKHPDAIFIHQQHAGLARQILAELGETPETVRLIAAEDLPHCEEFPGIYFQAPRREAAETAVAMLNRLMRGDRRIEHVRKEIKLVCNLTINNI